MFLSLEKVEMSTIAQLILIFCICKVTYSLKLIYNLQIHACGAFARIHRHVQSGEKLESPDVRVPS